LFFGTSGGRELVVAVVVVGPALTVPVADGAAAVLELLGLVEVVLPADVEEWLEPPQAAMTSATSTAAQSACRGIEAL
jgi:hypothetical protein